MIQALDKREKDYYSSNSLYIYIDISIWQAMEKGVRVYGKIY